MSHLRLEDVSVALDGHEIVRDIDLDVADGEFVGLVGPNGAGKTTVLGAVAGIVPHRGRITVDGHDVAAMG
ncbi:MAG: ATP-binding cassette domain-containing protein, partial [Acidimicrobiia bacterium]|nr:ATP-binding cassette domain-containing protein [Acidimicrobiia bacterium]